MKSSVAYRLRVNSYIENHIHSHVEHKRGGENICVSAFYGHELHNLVKRIVPIPRAIILRHTSRQTCMKRLLSEMTLTLSMSRIGVAPYLYDAWIHSKKSCYIFEYGISLEEFCESPLYQQSQIGITLGDALKYASSMHVVMLDIKMGNMVVTRNGDVKFIDFDPKWTLVAKASLKASVTQST